MVYNVTPQQPSNGLTVAEVFAGGGLMAVGLKSAGYELTWANDFEKTAVAAYKHNLGDHITLGDITQIDPTDIPDTDITAGGPPCQDFSVAGSGAGEDGDKGRLVWTYLSIIEKKQPKAFVFENVKGLIQKKHRHTFDALLVEFDRIGYTVSWQLVNSWDYGVAQKRERVFIVGTRKDLGFTYEFPQPEPGDVRTQVIRDAIGDLPEPAGQDNGQYWTPPDPEFIYAYDQSNRIDHTMDTPSPTVTAHHNSGKPIHPAQAPRRYTVRECLRIQSVPDWYVMPEMSLGAQYRIVGNGVASRVAWYIGKALAEQLIAATVSQTGAQEAAVSKCLECEQLRIELEFWKRKVQTIKELAG